MVDFAWAVEREDPEVSSVEFKRDLVCIAGLFEQHMSTEAARDSYVRAYRAQRWWQAFIPSWVKFERQKVLGRLFAVWDVLLRGVKGWKNESSLYQPWEMLSFLIHFKRETARQEPSAFPALLQDAAIMPWAYDSPKTPEGRVRRLANDIHFFAKKHRHSSGGLRFRIMARLLEAYGRLRVEPRGFSGQELAAFGTSAGRGMEREAREHLVAKCKYEPSGLLSWFPWTKAGKARKLMKKTIDQWRRWRDSNEKQDSRSVVEFQTALDNLIAGLRGIYGYEDSVAGKMELARHFPRLIWIRDDVGVLTKVRADLYSLLEAEFRKRAQKAGVDIASMSDQQRLVPLTYMQTDPLSAGGGSAGRRASGSTPPVAGEAGQKPKHVLGGGSYGAVGVVVGVRSGSGSGGPPAEAAGAAADAHRGKDAVAPPSPQRDSGQGSSGQHTVKEVVRRDFVADRAELTSAVSAAKAALLEEFKDDSCLKVVLPVLLAQLEKTSVVEAYDKAKQDAKHKKAGPWYQFLVNLLLKGSRKETAAKDFCPQVAAVFYLHMLEFVLKSPHKIPVGDGLSLSGNSLETEFVRGLLAILKAVVGKEFFARKPEFAQAVARCRACVCQSEMMQKYTGINPDPPAADQPGGPAAVPGCGGGS